MASRHAVVAAAVAAALAAPVGAGAETDAGAVDAGPGADAGAGSGGPLTVPAPPPDAPEVDVVAGAAEVRLGEAFSLFVTVRYGPGVQVNLPASLGLGEAFEELRRTSSVREATDALVREFEVEVIAWDVGDLHLPPLPVTYATGGRAATVYAEPVPIRVVSVIGEGEERLRDIAPPVPVDRPDWTLLYALGAGAIALLAAAIALWAVWIVRRRGRRRQAAEEDAARLSADQEALAHLDALARSGAAGAADRGPFYVELSEIARSYLGRRYGFSSLDMTSSELVEALRARPEAAPAVAATEELVARFDLIKYARGAAGTELAMADLERVRDLVLGTRAPTVAEAGDA